MHKTTIAAAIVICPMLFWGCAPQSREGSLDGPRVLERYDYEAEGNDRIPELAGRYLVTLDDADPPQATYTDDRRHPPSTDAGDTITVAQLPLTMTTAMPIGQAPLASTVAGPMRALDVSADGTFALALVNEKGVAQDIPVFTGGALPATGVVAVDLTDPLNPVVGKAFELDEDHSPMSVAIHPDGDLALLACRNSQSIFVLTIEAGEIIDAVEWPIDIDTDSPTRPTSVVWHPSGAGFAVSMAGYRHFAMFAVDRNLEDGSWSIRRWGGSVPTTPYPFTGCFSPDGRYYFTTDLAWSARTGWFTGASVGYISVYAIDPVAAEGAQHRRLGSIPVGRSPTSIAVSPDGSLIAVANAEGGFVPWVQVRTSTDGGILHLLQHDGQGGLEILTEVPTEVIPAGITFTPDGAHVLVAGYDENIISIWEIQEIADKPRLIDTGYGIEMGTGPHEIIVIP